MSSWNDFIDMDGVCINYGFIDEGIDEDDKDYGSRYFVSIGDKTIPVDMAEIMCKLCEVKKKDEDK